MKHRLVILVKYILCAIFFCGALLLAVKLSFLPDPKSRLHRPAKSFSESQINDYTVDNGDLILSEGRKKRQIRFYQTDDGVMAAEVPQKEEEAP